jgi:hypothetical protein
MIMFIVVLVVLFILWRLFCGGEKNHRDNEVTAYDMELHQQDGDSHVYYWDEVGDLVHESDSCSGCMENRVAVLRTDGFKIKHVLLGRNNSGNLS